MLLLIVLFELFVEAAASIGAAVLSTLFDRAHLLPTPLPRAAASPPALNDAAME